MNGLRRERRLRLDGLPRAGALAAALLAGGCLGHVHTPLASPYALAAAGRPLTAVEVSLDRPRRAEPERVEIVYRKRVLDYEAFDLSFPSSGVNHQRDNLVRARYYRRQDGGPRGLVIVLPIWGHSSYPPMITARRILRRGALDVLVLEGRRSLFDWQALGAAASEEAFLAEVREWVARYRTVVEDVRRLVDWASARPEVDRRRIAVVGFSMSAVVGATVAGLDPRVTHGAFVMGGGRIEEIFAACPKLPGEIRERLLARFGWTSDELERRLAPEFATINPVTWAARVDPRRILLIDADVDRCVPASAREGLWAAMGRPERITILSGHNFSFLSLTFVDNFRATKEIARFLHRRLQVGGEAVATASAASF